MSSGDVASAELRSIHQMAGVIGFLLSDVMNVVLRLLTNGVLISQVQITLLILSEQMRVCGEPHIHFPEPLCSQCS